MQYKYFAHTYSYNPFTSGFEEVMIYENSEINNLIRAMLEEIKNNRYLVEDNDNMNNVVNDSSDLFEETNILPEDDLDGGYSFFGVCNSIENNIQSLLTKDIADSRKFEVLKEQLKIYLSIVDYVPIGNDFFILKIEIFDNSREFSKYFFNNLKEAVNNDHPLYPIKQRIEDICLRIDNYDFPNNDYDEGVLGEWIAIYRLIIDAQD